VYTLALLTDRALTLQTSINVGPNQIVNGSCTSAAAGLAGLWTISTQK
jgi:hypothetical protein